MVLNNISMKIENKQHIGVVGPTGSGKVSCKFLFSFLLFIYSLWIDIDVLFLNFKLQ